MFQEQFCEVASTGIGVTHIDALYNLHSGTKWITNYAWYGYKNNMRLEGMVIGLPKAVGLCSTKYLLDMGVVGVYERVKEVSSNG
jgi:hypothetical protein